MMDGFRGFLVGLAWLALAAIIAVGGAGVVTAMQHAPGSESRAELTWAGDRAAVPALDSATAALADLSAAVRALGTTAREALVAAVGSDGPALAAAIERGRAEVATLDRLAGGLAAAIDAVPGMGQERETRVGATVRHRFDELATTTGVTAGLGTRWEQLTAQAAQALRVSELLARHDVETAAAAKEGSAGRYAEALALLDAPAATIAEARRLSEALAGSADVSTLGAWLDRNAAYDAALRALYESLVTSKGRVTAAVREALAGEASARAALPTDTRGIVVIMSELAKGGLNQAVIAIEEARGDLEAALATQQRLQAGPELPE